MLLPTSGTVWTRPFAGSVRDPIGRRTSHERSTLGAGWLLYGRRQTAVVPLVCGAVLMIYPYLVDDIVLMVAIGVVLVAIPFVVRDDRKH